jgi:hypothetical protein
MNKKLSKFHQQQAAAKMLFVAETNALPARRTISS